MIEPKTAEDFLPMLSTLSSHERVRLVRLLVQQTTSSDAEAYALMPPGEDEFSSDEEPLAWEAEGWEEFY
ncbi:MAG: hypothetical protein JNK74_05310 [Candidatus Hydrogenedentes bacterium]|nr:hypothetical protein [Candidatus Hydrogenedentota bacterium]